MKLLDRQYVEISSGTMNDVYVFEIDWFDVLMVQSLLAAAEVFYKPVKILSADYDRDSKQLVVVTQAPIHNTEPLTKLFKEAYHACTNMQTRAGMMLEELEGIE